MAIKGLSTVFTPRRGWCRIELASLRRQKRVAAPPVDLGQILTGRAFGKSAFHFLYHIFDKRHSGIQECATPFAREYFVSTRLNNKIC